MSIIAAGTTTTTALSSTGNTDGTLQLRVNGSTPSVTLNTLGAIGVGSTPNYGTAGQALLSNGSTSAAYWGSVSAAAATATSLGTVYGLMTTSGASPYLTALGYDAASVNTGVNNTTVGYQSLYNQTSGTNNTALGASAMRGGGAGITGSNNVGVGSGSLSTLTSGAGNTAIGKDALASNTTATNNTATGYQAGYANTASSGITAFGYQALTANTSGTENDAFGNVSLKANTTGGYNTSIGTVAMFSNTTGSNNVAVGNRALYANTTASGNTAVGLTSLTANTTGTNNTAYGNRSGLFVTTGNNNTCIGYNTGAFATGLTTGSNNTLIGYGADTTGGASTQQIVLCSVQSVGKGDNTGYINPNGGGVYQGNNSSSWSTTSDQRLKKNIADNNIGLDAINSIRVRNFEYRIEDEITELPTHCAIKKEGVQLGVIAQELQAVLPECVKQESTGVLSVDPDNLTWYLVNAVKELTARIAVLEGK